MLCPVPYNLSHVPSQPVHITIPRYKYFSISATSSVNTNPNMDQQSEYTKAEILDLSKQPLSFDCDDNTWLSSMLKVQKNHIVEGPVSQKELKIRNELEMEVERGLEEEIKDRIYNLSLRLHRLYQRQEERSVKEACEDNRNRALSEVNISIRMEGKTRVEIKETKKEATERGRWRSYRSEDVKQVGGLSANKFDWEKTLRAGSGSVSVNRTNEGSKRMDKIRTSDTTLYPSRKFDNRRGKNDRSSGKRDGNGKVDNKLLQFGWKV